MVKLFGVWGPKKFMGREYEGIHRMTFIFDENSVVSRVIEKVNTKNPTDQILKGLLKFGLLDFSYLLFQ